ncbi:D-ribitol-5-phosphate cytidylyltransferase-like isoform X1 [Porites lutea]|uniref:D-ribitol-5-phosphate cytidylyltransferase-like isoform X1 n=1 Tax=Porites lutea TaxID=51062 RepID=UPI003CC61DBD
MAASGDDLVEDVVEDVCFNVVAVLPAGGCGVRMNLEIPKQFYRIMGRPLISYTLEAFESVSWIKEIVVPIGENYLEVAKEVLREFSHNKVRLTSGGSTRHRSIWNGVEALTEDHRSPPNVVILHDAVRPFVDEQTLQSVVLAAEKYGAAGVIRPLASTVIAQSSDGFMDHSLDRSKYRSSEMPQAFQYEVIKNAYEKCTEYDFEHGTECLHLAQKYSETRAWLIDGPETLWKVTYKKDLYAVEGVLQEKKIHRALVIGQGRPHFCEQLKELLQKRNVAATFHSDLSAEKQDSFETLAEQLISEVSHHRVSVVFALDDKTSSTVCVPTSVMQFTREISRKCNHCHVKELRLIIVRFSNCRKNFTEFKLSIEEMKSRVHEQGVICFGVFVSLGLNNQKKNPDNSKLAEKAAELTIGALLDVSPIFNGQTFDAIT